MWKIASWPRKSIHGNSQKDKNARQFQPTLNQGNMFFFIEACLDSTFIKLLS